MKVIPPIDITPARLTSSNISEPTSTTAWSSGTNYVGGNRVLRSTTNNIYRCIKDTTAQTNTILPEVSVNQADPNWVSEGPPVWSSGTNYTPGQQVVRTSTNRVYQCLINTTPVNTTAPENLLTGSTIYWFDAGPSNKYAMFDLLRNSSSKAVGAGNNITVVIQPGVRVDSIAFVGLKRVETVRVTVAANSTATPTYDSGQITLGGRETLTWYQYFFTTPEFRSSTVLFDLPPLLNAYITITLLGSNIECGGIALGKYEEIGTVQRGATNDVINFSKVDRDVFGNATLVQRRNVPKTNQTLLLPAIALDRVRKLRDTLNGTTAVWVGLDDIPGQYYFESLLIVGFYKQFSISIDNPEYVTINLELEEV